jgi:hypothetical protein
MLKTTDALYRLRQLIVLLNDRAHVARGCNIVGCREKRWIGDLDDGEIGASLPPNVFVTQEDGGHRKSRGDGRLELDIVALRSRLLIRNDCSCGCG